MKVLLVEDDPALAEALGEALAGGGVLVERAASGGEADFLVRTETYDAVILDLGLPDGDGTRWLGQWREDGIALPVLVLTARTRWAIGIFRYEGILVPRIHVAQVVGRRSREAGHGIQFQWVSLFGSPVLGTSQRWLPRLCGQVLIYFGKLQRQFVFGQGVGHPLLVIDGERLPPVTLS